MGSVPYPGGFVHGSGAGNDWLENRSLFSGLMGGGIQEDGGASGGFLYDAAFYGTFWESDGLTLEAAPQDGYYKVAVTDGEKELSYLCEYQEIGLRPY